MHPTLRIISGGQTGVDRAALDAAQLAGLPCGGWCPRGRRAEDGDIDTRYPLRETPSNDYRQRTEWNVRDSDATLILNRGVQLRGGTALTHDLALQLEKPRLVIDLAAPCNHNVIRHWLNAHSVTMLNIAGPRESQQPGIYPEAMEFLRVLFSGLTDSGDE